MKMAKEMGIVPIYFVFLLTCLVGCEKPSPRVIATQAMGSRLHITLPVDVDDQAFLEVQVTALLERIEQSASQWRDASWVTRFNAAEPNVSTPVPPDVSAMLIEAKLIYEQTDGVFDVTAGPLVELWGFGASPSKGEPNEMQIAGALLRCGFDKLGLNEDATVIVKKAKGVTLDLSGLAKGYAVDQISLLLDERGVADYVIAFGGEVRAAGDGPSGDGWVVQVGASAGHTVTLRGQACATSGGSEQKRETSDGPVTHLIDPRTGRPMREPSRSATVVADTCMRADGWATALAIDPALAVPDGVQIATPE